MEWESVHDWIRRQGWPEFWEEEALLMVKNRNELGMNPLTGSQWISWAKAKGLTTTLRRG